MEKICFISDGEIKFKQTKMVMQLVVCNPFFFFNEKLRDIDVTSTSTAYIFMKRIRSHMQAIKSSFLFAIVKRNEEDAWK